MPEFTNPISSHTTLELLANSLEIPAWIQRSIQSGIAPEIEYSQLFGREDELINLLAKRARTLSPDSLTSGTIKLAIDCERFPVDALGDAHACSLEPLVHDLVKARVIKPDLTWHPNFSGKFIQMGDTVDRGPSGVGVYLLFERLQQNDPSKIDRLIGNHEIAHLFGYENAIGAPSLPGFRAKLINDILCGRVLAATVEGDTIYTHAGIDIDLFPEFQDLKPLQIADELNFRLQIAALTQQEIDPIFNQKRGIFWKRAEYGASLASTSFRQVVGHTPQPHGIIALPGLRVKYIDAGRVFAELGYRGFDKEWGRQMMLNTQHDTQWGTT